jgi:hypothetical protein
LLLELAPMRFSPARALLFSRAFGVVVGTFAAVWLSGCASDTTAATGDSDSALGDDELNAVNNKMGLRLTYDDPSGHVRATLKMKLHETERLVMRVRRGRLMAGGQIDLDCSQLAEAPPLVPAPSVLATTTTTAAPSTAPGTKPIYVGPEIDSSLLASVYNQQWIDQNISADVLEELSVDGTDAIVDACIVRGEGVRARLQTSLPYAWDPADPRIDPAFAHP